MDPLVMRGQWCADEGAVAYFSADYDVEARLWRARCLTPGCSRQFTSKHPPPWTAGSITATPPERLDVQAGLV